MGGTWVLGCPRSAPASCRPPPLVLASGEAALAPRAWPGSSSPGPEVHTQHPSFAVGTSGCPIPHAACRPHRGAAPPTPALVFLQPPPRVCQEHQGTPLQTTLAASEPALRTRPSRPSSGTRTWPGSAVPANPAVALGQRRGPASQAAGLVRRQRSRATASPRRAGPTAPPSPALSQGSHRDPTLLVPGFDVEIKACPGGGHAWWALEGPRTTVVLPGAFQARASAWSPG